MNHTHGLRALRLDKGWSQEQLAAISGLSERTIQRAERGDTPSLETVGALAASFDLSSAQMRDIIQAPREASHMTETSSSASSTPPVLTAPRKRVLLWSAIYVGVLTWLGLMVAFLGWDPELIGFVALVGGGLLVPFAAMQLMQTGDSDT
ncbi:MAG: transcriptional regulator [Oceanicaulis sp.]|jgi:transcriptional regulator with XRE-family HTH domain|uniref:helix-turn-helix transcriptional regulator n=1 Tax=Oceanicaulis sp. TaxID=1924941 RepID=UPI000C4258D0|nr:helix-turn-helix transcriptional regulator [Oceanicaulis sp.]MAB69263.1 transcriptional regulator [Oceanicaulis sp.]MBC37530.1 transcriptional regulator [Oceanicaulis sp.]HCR94038.1 XRE family transcriptional regulator [Oceanicaulis sp.]|tara:strand:- start:145 stop:594 length:450 start_codon:yes stop_codon:yes gene_type:complete